jgi:hypothetical protein
LFECGFFAAKRVTDESQKYQLICVNSGNARPAPLQMWQDVSSRDALGDVLRQYCEGDGHFEEVNPDAARLRVYDKTAQELWNEFVQRKPAATPPQWAETLKRRRLMIYITTDAMKSIEQGADIPPDADVEVSEGAIKDIFPNAQATQRWEQFQECLDDRQKAWTRSLSIVLRMLNSKRTQSPILPLVRGAILVEDQVVRYRPAVVQRDELSGSSLRFHIEFMRSLDALAMTPGDRADGLYHWLVLGRNFREGVLRVYEDRFERAKTYEDALEQMKQFEAEIALTRLEMESRGLDIDQALMEVFQPAVKVLIEDLEHRWDAWMSALKERQASFARRRGPLSDDDHSALTGAITTVLYLNELFCAVTAGAYQGMRMTTRGNG